MNGVLIDWLQRPLEVNNSKTESRETKSIPFKFVELLIVELKQFNYKTMKLFFLFYILDRGGYKTHMDWHNSATSPPVGLTLKDTQNLYVPGIPLTLCSVLK